MPLVRSNVAWAAVGEQVAKGTPLATVKAFKTRLASDARINPRAETAVFAETDGSRDAPNSEKVTGGAEGGFAFGVRDSFFHKVAEWTIGTGSKATTGTTNYVHTISSPQATPVTDMKYLTVDQALGGTTASLVAGATSQIEQYSDMVINELSVTVEAGGFMTASLTLSGRVPTRLGTAPPALAEAGDALYQYNDAAVSLGGSGTGLIRSMNMTIGNNVQLLQTDDIVPYDVHVGTREVTLGFDMLFENFDHYNTFHFGSTTSANQSAATTVTDLNFLFTKGVNNSIEFDFDAVNYEEFPIAPDTGGDPIIVSARVRARRNTNGLTKIIVKNQTAT
jgi:Phage tail tube protein